MYIKDVIYYELVIQLLSMLNKSPVTRQKNKRQFQFSEVLTNIRRRQDSQNQARSISIKINRNKLPADFFPHTQSIRKNKAVSMDRKKNSQNLRKAQSQRDNYSPQKTSFFGFFEEKPLKKTLAQLNNLKRKFQSRQQPKRERVVPEFRHYTPMTGLQRSDLLYMYPDQPDCELTQALMYSSKTKGLQMSPRKQHLSKYQQRQQQINPIDPQEQQIQRQNPNKIQTNQEENAHNITFFNARSTSFPPINKNRS